MNKTEKGIMRGYKVAPPCGAGWPANPGPDGDRAAVLYTPRCVFETMGAALAFVNAAPVDTQSELYACEYTQGEQSPRRIPLPAGAVLARSFRLVRKIAMRTVVRGGVVVAREPADVRETP